ncbi:MAG: hypothetical protein HY738_24555 [Bacteroidia bacterium]|nr:hypothetical protein [Bacteroidia bacterium]
MTNTNQLIEKFPLELQGLMMEFYNMVVLRPITNVRDDILELKEIVKQLAEAQKQTERSVRELAEAQKQTEHKVSELAEAQKQLTDAQKQTEHKVSELAEAQKQTELQIQKLVLGLKSTRQQVGALSDSFGYSLENKAIKKLPEILSKEFGFQITGKFERKYIQLNGEYIELNITGKLKKGEEEYTLLGEAMNRLKTKELNKFIQNCRKIGGNQFRVLISHILPPQMVDVLKKDDIHFIPSYQIE